MLGWAGRMTLNFFHWAEGHDRTKPTLNDTLDTGLYEWSKKKKLLISPLPVDYAYFIAAKTKTSYRLNSTCFPLQHEVPYETNNADL